jgi:hypothetical protein
MLKKAQFSFILLLFFISSFFLVPKIVFGGTNDQWKVCCVGCTYSPGDATSVAGTTYYCCCADSTAAWGTSSCSYPQNVPYCNKAGKTYFADQQNSDCTYSDRGDNICRSAGSFGIGDGCTADSTCNGKKPGDSCGTGKTCDSSCKCITTATVACYSDSDCNDNNPCTADTCVNPGTTSSYCTHSNLALCTACPSGYCDGSGNCVSNPCGTCKYCSGGSCVNRPDGYNDCGPGCQRCISGICKDYNPACEGTASSCYCSNDACIACSPSGCCDAICSAYSCGLSPNNAKCPSGQTCNQNCQCVAALGSIEGTVKDANTTNPISDATVSASGSSSGSASTDSNGYYLISNLNSGSYTVTASATGYNSQSKSASVSAGSTTTVNFDLTPFCDYNKTCDPGETQPCSDCQTFVSIYPTYTYPGQQVTITVYFNDSRFDVDKSTYDVEFDLFISNIPWNSTNGCDIGSKKLRSEVNCGCGTGGCKGKHGYYGSSEYWVDFVDGYAKITATCKIPPNIAAGSHTLKAIPVIYSSTTPLNPGEAVFEVASPLEKILSDLQVKIISLLRKITGLFILR